MPGKPTTILVTGATGKQGSATARHLLARGYKVRAMTRDPLQPKAQMLARSGIDVCRADLDDADSVRRALEEAQGVFSVQSFVEHGPEGEVRQGRQLADLALEQGVEHFIYTSVGGAERETGITHFETKARIEAHIAAIGLPATVIRPVAFMESFSYPFFITMLCAGVLLGTQEPQARWQLIACEDVGRIAATIFAERDEFLGRQIEIAGDEPSMLEAADTFSRVLGRSVKYVQIQSGGLSSEIAQGIDGFNRTGQFQADVNALRSRWPALLTLEQWLRAQGWDHLMDRPHEVELML
ncbi:MAG: NmrA/HSCARG family protein [Blastocatellia bacterium]